jgi:GTPase
LRAAGAASLAALAAGGKTSLATALAALERSPDGQSTLALLNAAYAAPRAQVVGVTGPPGVGKSTLTSALIALWRSAGKSVGVIAVDPSSRISGGALLGDRTRIRTDPADGGVFVRSMAARDKLGGLASLSFSAMVLMRALFDVVLIETVGVGQSETDVAGAADTILLCVQPGSGDTLQFMKAGIVEIPHIIAVTKGDLGAMAEQARREAIAVLGHVHDSGGEWLVPVIKVSALRHEGTADLLAAIEAHWRWLAEGDRLSSLRRAQAARWLTDSVRERFGRDGLMRAGEIAIGSGESPFEAMARLAKSFRR